MPGVLTDAAAKAVAEKLQSKPEEKPDRSEELTRLAIKAFRAAKTDEEALKAWKALKNL